MARATTLVAVEILPNAANMPPMLNWLTKLFSLPGDDLKKAQIVGVRASAKWSSLSHSRDPGLKDSGIDSIPSLHIENPDTKFAGRKRLHRGSAQRSAHVR
jgi:hypothetical protein